MTERKAVLSTECERAPIYDGKTRWRIEVFCEHGRHGLTWRPLSVGGPPLTVTVDELPRVTEFFSQQRGGLPFRLVPIPLPTHP
jgi:hypothetical protein